MLKMIKWNYSGFLSYSFSDFLKSAWLLLVEKAKVEKFRTISAGTAVQKSPTLHFRLFQRTFLWHLFENIAAVFTLIPELFQFTHIQSDHGAPTSSGVWSKSIYIHGVWSSPEQARLLSLTQTAAPLQSSVVHFVVAVKSFPSAVALFSPFGVFPQRKQTNNRPFPLHFSWCWTSKGGSQRSWNILLEWYFESCSPLCFFLSHDEILGCCNNSACVCVCMRVKENSSHREQRQFKVTAKWQAGSSGLLNCIVFFLFLLWRRVGGGEKSPNGTQSEQFSLRRITLSTNKNSSHFLLTNPF